MEYTDTRDGLEAAAETARAAGLFAADTEAAGYHRYSDNICLIQLSTRDRTFIADPLALPDLEPLRGVLADEAVETVFHDADYDLRLLHRDYDMSVRGLFDTKIAAEFLGEPALGLAGLLEANVGVKIPKKFQRADWAQRPLPVEMVEYAAEDTRHLLQLRDRLRERLVESGRLAWAEEEFRLRETTVWDSDSDDDAWRLKGSHLLDRRRLAVLREVWFWRDDIARQRDQAPFRVIGNDALMNIAQEMPGSEPELRALKGVADAHVRRYARALLDAVSRAREIPDDALPPRPPRPPRRRHDPDVDERAERLRAVRDQTAESLGLDRGFVLPRHQMQTIARENPASVEELSEVEGVRRWQIETMGDEIVRMVRAG